MILYIENHKDSTTSKRMKYLGIHLTKEAKDLNTQKTVKQQ